MKQAIGWMIFALIFMVIDFYAGSYKSACLQACAAGFWVREIFYLKFDRVFA